MSRSSGSYSWLPGFLRKFLNLDDEMPNYGSGSTYTPPASYSAPAARPSATYTPPSYQPSSAPASYTPPSYQPSSAPPPAPPRPAASYESP